MANFDSITPYPSDNAKRDDRLVVWSATVALVTMCAVLGIPVTGWPGVLMGVLLVICLAGAIMVELAPHSANASREAGQFMPRSPNESREAKPRK